MSDELTCRIVGQLADIICMLEDQLHELREVRGVLEERLPKFAKPVIKRNPPQRHGKKINITEIQGCEPHDLGMSEARKPPCP